MNFLLATGTKIISIQVNLGVDYRQNKILHLFSLVSLTVVMVKLQNIQSKSNNLSLMRFGYIGHPLCKPYNL